MFLDPTLEATRKKDLIVNCKLKLIKFTFCWHMLKYRLRNLTNLILLIGKYIQDKYTSTLTCVVSYLHC